jgi:hypothetical protein
MLNQTDVGWVMEEALLNLHPVMHYVLNRRRSFDTLRRQQTTTIDANIRTPDPSNFLEPSLQVPGVWFLYGTMMR